ncbi:MAG: type II toxin-antitoxin system prevent-host-death family antitoxin [Armatimonadetes bacterium]|nr:type II toxin-antitoxin system prevent-host-death family antitoxin [Armatimonadota bacterium]NIO96938.1 type II toxin-antitoxin system prevent-host-death family antitoxin [Armatimonadota bacterium]
MNDVGIRELKAKASEILRRAREPCVRYVITYRGHPLAVLGPLEASERTAGGSGSHDGNDSQRQLGALGERIR